ncbi:MAG TPA: DUF488 domain-containing protein [Verrucomicrobiae bacterium]|jgi:uncharacterized protein (DUF488 family)|nr:DUF488 domain-containing protein [Verrucomicrobiae bacterium]
MEEPAEIWTIGHSRHTMEELSALLKTYQIQAVADVRRFAVSRRHPQFNEMDLFKSLAKDGIEYESFAELGGRRRPTPDSPNSLWRNESFRGYADFMLTPEFAQGMNRLLELAASKRLAIMCAEVLWWRCHRALLADWLKARGLKVTHILSATKAEEHPYTSAARLENGKLTYAPKPNLELELR